MRRKEKKIKKKKKGKTTQINCNTCYYIDKRRKAERRGINRKFFINKKHEDIFIKKYVNF